MTRARVACLAALFLTCACSDRIPTSARDSWGPAERVTSKCQIRFAVIGDYGHPGQAAHDVARMVTGWRPDLIITTGDNNYPDGKAATIDLNIGRRYHRFLSPYHGSYGQGGHRNRFFPSLGNHDLKTDGGLPYLDYFTLPGNERYYDFLAGPVHFFALNSSQREPDGTGAWSAQRSWLRERLVKSDAPWKIVYFHHPPYSSGREHSEARWMRWPFASWGADVVLSGHEHLYERLAIDNIAYIVVGLSGAPKYEFKRNPRRESRVRFAEDHGALLADATPNELSLSFTTRSGTVIDRVRLHSEKSTASCGERLLKSDGRALHCSQTGLQLPAGLHGGRAVRTAPRRGCPPYA